MRGNRASIRTPGTLGKNILREGEDSSAVQLRWALAHPPGSLAPMNY
jgi:hypothetical protein